MADMHERILGWKLFAAASLCVVIFAVSSAAAAFKNIGAGDQAFPVELTDLEGQEYTLARYGADAEAVVVLFWATWSERSLKELEDLQRLSSEYSDEGLRILAVNVEKQTLDSEDLQRIRSILHDKQVDFPVLLDEGLKTYNEWGVIATPTTAIIDGKGTVVFDLSSYPTSGFLDLDEAVRKALGIYTRTRTPDSADDGYKPARKAMLHLGLGKRHVEKGFLTKALPEFQKAAEADSGWADPWIYIGYLHIKEGQSAKAGESLQRAEELEQGREEVLLLRSYLLLSEQRVDEALTLLQSGKVSELPDNPEPLSAAPEPQTAAQREPDRTLSEAPDEDDSLADARTLVEGDRMEEASERLEEAITSRLAELGFSMRKKKTLGAMEKMKLMMERKQEQQ